MSGPICVQLKKRHNNHSAGSCVWGCDKVDGHVYIHTHSSRCTFGVEGHNLACTLAMISGGRSLIGRCPTSTPLSAVLWSVFSQLF